jgi:hypothetical protein
MFPPANAIIDRNEAGEPTGWDVPEEGPPYCDICGFAHGSHCPEEPDEDDDDDDPNNVTDFESHGVSGYEL